MKQSLKSGSLILVGTLALAGCSDSSGGSSGGGGGAIDPNLTTDSRIITLNADGTLPDVGIDEDNSVSVTSRSNVGGFAYQIGRVEGQDRFLGVAGIAPDTQVGSTPTSATGTYSGTYSLTYADRNEFGDPVSGRITLNADFDNQRLTGQAGGLNVAGTLAGQTIGGTATYRGVDANLSGRIGDARAVGAFAGNNPDAVLTGGFIADRTN